MPSERCWVCFRYPQGTQGVVTLQLFGKGADGKELFSKELKLESRWEGRSRCQRPPVPLCVKDCVDRRRAWASADRGLAGFMPLFVASRSRDNFTRNRTDNFFLKLPDLGEVQKCRVSLAVR